MMLLYHVNCCCLILNVVFVRIRDAKLKESKGFDEICRGTSEKHSLFWLNCGRVRDNFKFIFLVLKEKREGIE